MQIGILGLGSIGMVHAKNLRAMGHDIYTHDIADPTSHGLELMEDAEAIVIATPSDQHTIDMYCHFQSKHLFVEKPIGTSDQCAIDIKAMLAVSKKVIMVANNCRYHPVVKVVKERMHELGGPYHGAWFRLHQEKKDAKDPVILNWGAHEVDLALYLLSKNLSVMPGHSKVAHDHAEFIIRYGSGSLVHIDLSYHGPSDRCFAIHGPDASILGDLDNFTVHIFSRQGREIIAVEGSHEQTYVDEMKEFIKRVESGGASTDGIGATGEDGLRCLKVLLEAQNA